MSCAKEFRGSCLQVKHIGRDAQRSYPQMPILVAQNELVSEDRISHAKKLSFWSEGTLTSLQRDPSPLFHEKTMGECIASLRNR